MDLVAGYGSDSSNNVQDSDYEMDEEVLSTAPVETLGAVPDDLAFIANEVCVMHGDSCEFMNTMENPAGISLISDEGYNPRSELLDASGGGGSDSDDDDSDDDADDDNDNSNNGGDASRMKVEIDAFTEEEVESMPSGPLRSKNEVEDLIIPLPHIDIVELATLRIAGEVMYAINHECAVVIKACKSAETLRDGSVLCSRDGVPLGVVQEVFGPVLDPFYVLKISSDRRDNISTDFPVGSPVYTVPQHSLVITPSQLSTLKSKGSDASNAFDEEPAEDELEYSDDEQEMAAKQTKRKQKRSQESSGKTSSVSAPPHGAREATPPVLPYIAPYAQPLPVQMSMPVLMPPMYPYPYPAPPFGAANYGPPLQQPPPPAYPYPWAHK